MKRIVLTGGPGAGKTVVAEAIVARHPERLALVSEAASRVHGEAGTRWDRLNRTQRCQTQRRIYHLQLEQERQVEVANPGKILLLDRGTVDGAAYWPDGAADYWRALGTTAAAELERYDAVFWLQTCAILGEQVYDGSASNPCRFEDGAAAVRMGRRLADVWKGHPRFMAIEVFPTIGEKIEAVDRAVRELLR